MPYNSTRLIGLSLGGYLRLRVTDLGVIREVDQQDELLAFCQEFGFNRLIVGVSIDPESAARYWPHIGPRRCIAAINRKGRGAGYPYRSAVWRFWHLGSQRERRDG